MLKKTGNDDEQSSKDKKKNKKEKGYNKIGDKSPDGPTGENSSRASKLITKPSSLKKPTFRLPSAGKKEKQKSVKINEEPIVDRPRSSTVPSMGGASNSFLELDMSMPTAALPADLVVLLEGRPVFGQSLSTAPRCHDTALPVIVRECIDYLEQRLNAASTPSQLESLQGLYQRAADKAAIDRLRDSYERGELVSLDSCNPADIAGLLQAYLRSLPAPILTTSLIQKFEQAADTKPEQCVPELRQFLLELPPLNRTVLAWLSVHFKHLCTVTSVKPASLALSLQTTLQMSHRLLVVFIEHVEELFPGVAIRPYVPQWVLCLPDAIAAVEEDLRWREMHLEGLLARLAANSSADIGGEPTLDKAAVEQSWEQQRIVTQLKRKLKKLKKYTEAGRRPGGIMSSGQDSSMIASPGKLPIDSSALSSKPSLPETPSSSNSQNPPQSFSNQNVTKSDQMLQQPQADGSTGQQSTNNASSQNTSVIGDGDQSSGDNARVLYAELKDLFGLLKMMKGRNPQNIGSQSADSSLILTQAREVEGPVLSEPVKPAETVSIQAQINGSASIAADVSPKRSPEINENTAPVNSSTKDHHTPDQMKQKVPSPVIEESNQQDSHQELLEQRRSIQLAYLWLKIEETEYQNLIAETEKMLEQERQLIKQLAGTIAEKNDPDADSIADSEAGGMDMPATIAGSSMALLANEELANDDGSEGSTTSDEDTHLNNTHKAVMLMRQNEKLERIIQDLERTVLTESEECLQLRVQLRFLELLSSDNEATMENSAIIISQILNKSSSTLQQAPPITQIQPSTTEIGA